LRAKEKQKKNPAKFANVGFFLYLCIRFAKNKEKR